MSQKNISSILWLWIIIVSCRPNTIPYTENGDWIVRSQLNGPGRSEAVGFTIGSFEYLGTGWDGLNTRFSDFWKYDPAVDSWSQIQSMPDSAARSSAVGLSINGKGYVGTGYDGYNYLSDFWEYDTLSNAWTRKAAFSGGARYEAVGFGIGNYGYIGTGFDGSYALKDFYRYDPSADTWTVIDFSGNKRYSAVSFIYKEKAYVVTGINGGVLVNDFWVYDPSLSGNNWTELRHINNYSTETYDDGYSDIVRSNASAFVITGTKSGDLAFLSTGENGSIISTTWEYNFATDLWSRKSNFEGPPTSGAVGFYVPNRGFIATGRSGNGQAAQSDFLWEFLPDAVLNPNDN
jgi:N-acetylneuraminic acid mutarotase